MEAYSEDLVEEIDKLILLRSTLKQQSKWDEADDIQNRLWKEPYCVTLFDTKMDDSSSSPSSNLAGTASAAENATRTIRTTWQPRISISAKEPQRVVVWEQLAQKPAVTINNNKIAEKLAKQTTQITFLLGTVNNPHYRARYEETIEHLQKWQDNCSCSCCSTSGSHSHIAIQPCYLLDIKDSPSIGVKQILYEGWRQKIVPQLLQQLETHFGDETADNSNNFVLIGEDDIRIPHYLAPSTLVDICRDALKFHPELELLSLGHSWKALSNQKRRQADPTASNLFQFLKGTKGAGVHASTLFAIRIPNGVHRLRAALETAAEKKKQTHLDQFLFYSVYHDLNLALSDPPVVGWAEVEVTLTKSGSGHRRRGGGRLGFLPPTSPTAIDHISWIRRKLVELESEN